MSSIPAVVEKRIRLSVERANRLNRLAEIHQIREDQIIERALHILFTLTDLFATTPRSTLLNTTPDGSSTTSPRMLTRTPSCTCP